MVVIGMECVEVVPKTLKRPQTSGLLGDVWADYLPVSPMISRVALLSQEYASTAVQPSWRTSLEIEEDHMSRTYEENNVVTPAAETREITNFLRLLHKCLCEFAYLSRTKCRVLRRCVLKQVPRKLQI